LFFPPRGLIPVDPVVRLRLAVTGMLTGGFGVNGRESWMGDLPGVLVVLR
jgi:hypothetical protein